MSKKNRHVAPLLAGSALLVLDVAMDRWQANNAKTPLGVLIEKGFEDLVRLGTLT